MNQADNSGQEHLNFLKAVVDDRSDQPSKNGTDSDKENEHRDSVMSATTSSSIATKEYAFDLASETKCTTPTMSKEDSDMWDDFYTEEEFVKEEVESRDNEFDLVIPGRRLDKVEEEEEDNYAEESDVTENHLRENDSDKPDRESNTSNKNSSSVKKKKKRLFKRRLPPPLSPQTRTLMPIGGSHPNLSQQGNRYYRNDSLSSTDNNGILDTMSDTSGGERKLLRRKQVSRPRCAGPKPNGDRLEQKYQELEHLMLKPLPNPAVYVQQTRQQMVRLQSLSGKHNHHDPPVGLPPTGQHIPGPRDTEKTDRVIQIIDEDTNQVYSTMKTVHANRQNNYRSSRNNRPSSALPKKRPLSGQRQLRQKPRPRSAGQAERVVVNGNSEPISDKESFSRSSRRRKPRIRESGGRENSRSDSNVSDGSRRKSDRSESGSKDRGRYYGSSSFEDGTDSRSASRSPGRAPIQSTDNHLKNSSNPALRQWLKVKDKEYRLQKREEKKKKSREIAEKQEEEMRKEETLKKAEVKVKEWMAQKRKEAWRHAKEERKRKKEEERDIEEQIKHTESLRGKMFTPIQRPAGKYESDSKSPDQQHLENNVHTTPQPPKSKFVYKRPVSGRVRLMKLQQERKEDTKKLDERKKEMDEMLAKEKDRKMRMSYDQWLLKKREDDYTKRRQAAKQRALAKSDPELDRIVPEMARRRIENLHRGKKRIDTGDNAVDQAMNKSFGGADFGENESNTRPSYRLEVSGDSKSLKERPSSAKNTSSFNPQMSRSPRRPQSANPRVQAVMDESDNLSLNPDNSFKLPFPPELGVPKYVASRQEKLFSGQVIESATLNASAVGDGGRDNLGDDGGDGNKSGKTNGSDHVDTEAPFEPQLKSVADSVIGSKTKEEEEHAGAEEKNGDQSFFVTHGNFEKKGDDIDSDENQADDVANLKECADEDDRSANDNSNSDKGECQEAEKGMNGDDSNGVPPIEIGDDESTEIKYEMEEGETEEDSYLTEGEDEKMEEGVTAETGSVLLANVEQVTESVDVKSSIKHVSFSDEATIHEDPLAGIMNDDEDFYDDDDGEDREFDVRDDDDNDDGAKDDLDDGDLDEIEGYKDEDGEAEDERGDDF